MEKAKGPPYLIVVSAPSGAGKTTLCQRLLSDHPELELSISTTTREPRGQEQDGREYHFISREKFQEQIDAGRFAEWALVHGNFYGTSKDVIEKAFARGHSVLLDIDVQGAASLKKSYGDACIGFFIAPPGIDALEARLRARATDSEETILKRLRNAEEEMKSRGSFEHQIINDHLDRAYSELDLALSGYLRNRSSSHG